MVRFSTLQRYLPQPGDRERYRKQVIHFHAPMTKPQQIAMGYLGIIVSLVTVALLPELGGMSSPQMMTLASFAMLNVINIAHASDHIFLYCHRPLVAIIIAGIVLPLLYATGVRILTSTEWPFPESTRYPLLLIDIIVLGGSAVGGFIRSTRYEPVPEET